MFAWESKRHAQHWHVDGFKTEPRAYFLHFLRTKRFQGQCATRDAILKLIASIKPGSENQAAITNMAAFFNAASEADSRKKVRRG